MQSSAKCAITKFVANFIIDHSTKELLCKWNDKENIKAFNAILKINQIASPKRGKSAYNFFCSEIRPQLKKEFAKDLISAEISRRWKIVKENKDLLDKYTKITSNDKKQKTSCEHVQNQNSDASAVVHKNISGCEDKEKIFDENVIVQKPESLKPAHDGAEGHWLEDRIDKQQIIALFNNNVKGVEICLEGQNINHCGKEGHWLETKMCIKHNAKNEPDINGYEMKTGDKVTTFIDKAPDIMYLNGEELPRRNKNLKEEYWKKYASTKETDKPTIGGWSIDKFNKSGQKLIVDECNNIVVLYDYKEDTRENKELLELNVVPHIILQWNVKSLSEAINNKFNKKGFFKCIKENKKFTKICFGKPITFDIWINELKKGVIYHDGYSKLDGRGRHVFRASNKFWNELITEEY